MKVRVLAVGADVFALFTELGQFSWVGVSLFTTVALRRAFLFSKHADDMMYKSLRQAMHWGITL